MPNVHATRRTTRDKQRAERKAAIIRREWRQLRLEFLEWSDRARTQGGEAVEIYQQVRQKYKKAYQKMRNLENELEKLQYKTKGPGNELGAIHQGEMT